MRLVLAFALLLAACKVADSSSPAVDLALADPRGQAVLAPADDRLWLQGDLHVHSIFSTDTDWSRPSTPALIREAAIARGLEFVLLTDHSNSTGSEAHCREHPEPNDCVEQDHLLNLGPDFPFWASAATLRDEALLLVDGNEASPVDLSGSTARGHVNIVPRDLDAFDPDWIVVDRPSGAVTGGWAIGAAHAHGALAILNHPYSPGGVPPGPSTTGRASPTTRSRSTTARPAGTTATRRRSRRCAATGARAGIRPPSAPATITASGSRSRAIRSIPRSAAPGRASSWTASIGTR